MRAAIFCLLIAIICGLSAANAVAQGTEVPFGGLSHDSSLPVEISADSLSVDQKTGLATFSGNVVVGQGDLRLAASQIEVRYDTTGSTGAVNEMRATGKVTLTNGSEAAEAARALYTVASGQVLMEGDVLLTQGQNAISGEALRIDLTSGQARMEGRVRTIFQPSTGR